MWVIYNKSERAIVGLTPNSVLDVDKSTALKETVEGLVKREKVSAYDAIQVNDHKKAQEYMDAFPEKLVLTGTAKTPKLTFRDPEVFSLYITSNAPDKHPVDGIPEIAADGKGFTTLTIKKMDERYKPQRGTKDNEVLYLRTDYGTLRDENGKKDISRIQLKKGEAKIRLYSEKLKRVATIQIITPGNALRDSLYRIEFI